MNRCNTIEQDPALTLYFTSGITLEIGADALLHGCQFLFVGLDSHPDKDGMEGIQHHDIVFDQISLREISDLFHLHRSTGVRALEQTRGVFLVFFGRPLVREVRAFPTQQCPEFRLFLTCQNGSIRI